MKVSPKKSELRWPGDIYSDKAVSALCTDIKSGEKGDFPPIVRLGY